MRLILIFRFDPDLKLGSTPYFLIFDMIGMFWWHQYVNPDLLKEWCKFQQIEGVFEQVMGINQFDPEPDPHFWFLCEHGARSRGGFTDSHWMQVDSNVENSCGHFSKLLKCLSRTPFVYQHTSTTTKLYKEYQVPLKKHCTVDSRYLELGYLEFCETRSVYLNQKYILIAFSNHYLAL